jgi:hypothetical protein
LKYIWWITKLLIAKTHLKSWQITTLPSKSNWLIWEKQLSSVPNSLNWWLKFLIFNHVITINIKLFLMDMTLSIFPKNTSSFLWESLPYVNWKLPARASSKLIFFSQSCFTFSTLTMKQYKVSTANFKISWWILKTHWVFGLKFLNLENWAFWNWILEGTFWIIKLSNDVFEKDIWRARMERT